MNLYEKNNISDPKYCSNIKENLKYFNDKHSYPIKFQVKSLCLTSHIQFF